MIGALLVDKPSGPTSHDVVAFTRRLLKTSRIGHTGTLDPLATGLLVLLVGAATRLARFLGADEKEYIADVRLGVATPTYDAASLTPGAPRAASGIRHPTAAEIEAVLDAFRGTFMQMPPPFSAKKVAGVRAYESARRNDPVGLKAVPVMVRELEVLPGSDAGRTSDRGDGGLLRLRVVASAGFYVRSLAHDIGQALGYGAHLEALRRIRAGRFRVDDAATLDELEGSGAGAAERLIPVNALLADLPPVTLTEDGLRRAANGNPLSPAHTAGASRSSFLSTAAVAYVRVLDPSGEVMAVAEPRPDGLLHPLVVLR